MYSKENLQRLYFILKNNNISYHFKKWGFVQSPIVCQAGVGNNNPPGYNPSSQILTGYSASDTVNNEKCLHLCNMDLKYSTKKYLHGVS